MFSYQKKPFDKIFKKLKKKKPQNKKKKSFHDKKYSVDFID